MAFSDSIYAYRELILLVISSLTLVGCLGYNLLEGYRRKLHAVIDHLMQRVEFGKEDDDANIVETLGERLGIVPDPYRFLASLASRGLLLAGVGAPSVRHHRLFGDAHYHVSNVRLVYSPTGRGIAWYQRYRQRQVGLVYEACLFIALILGLMSIFLIVAQVRWHNTSLVISILSIGLFLLSGLVMLDAPPRASQSPARRGMRTRVRVGSVTERSLQAIIARMPSPKARVRV